MNIADIVNDRIESLGQSRRAVARGSGVGVTALNDFLQGKSNLNSTAVGQLLDFLGLTILVTSMPTRWEPPAKPPKRQKRR